MMADLNDYLEARSGDIRPSKLETIELRFTQIAESMAVDDEVVQSARFEEIRDEMLRRLVYHVSLTVATQEFEPVTAEWPHGWRDYTLRAAYAWRLRGHRVVPSWFRERWPVRLDTLCVEPKAYFPRIAAPEHKHVVHLWRYDGRRESREG